MNSHRTISSIASVSHENTEAALIQRLLQYMLCAGMGIVGGAVGVALTIGAVILIQSILFPAVIFTPGAMVIAVAAVLVGLAISWLISRIARLTLPTLFEQLDERPLQVIFVFSVLTSLLQTILFIRVL